MKKTSLLDASCFYCMGVFEYAESERTGPFPRSNIFDSFLLPSHIQLISAFDKPVLFGGTYICFKMYFSSFVFYDTVIKDFNYDD